ncbi:putative uncharacterized protein [Burkholderiales bacterium GJ-E10]|nr:putative uncharacterized protein [Burkholderiales bacterium GJ-E10]
MGCRQILSASLCTALFATLSAAAMAQDYGGEMPRQLTVLVRDTPPGAPATVRQGSDNSYSVSTGTGDDSDNGDGDGTTSSGTGRGADNGYSVSTDEGGGGAEADATNGADGSTSVSVNTHIARYEVVEGEVVRMNLPSVQSLQFYAPIAGTGAAPGTAAANAGTAATQGIGPGVGGAVFFQGVSAFSVRFAVQGREVVADLLPLQIGGVAAPYGYGVQNKPRPFRIHGRVGQWIELGEPGTQTTQTLGAVPDGAPSTGVWVKVLPH